MARATSASAAATSPSETSIPVTAPTLTTRSASRCACARSWVTSTIEQGSPARVRSTPSLARSSRAAVGSSSSSTSGSSASARASITRCCSPTDRRAASRSANSGSRPGQLERAQRIDLAAEQAGAVADVVGHAARQRRRQLGHEHGTAAQLERRRASGRRRRGSARFPRPGSASRLSSRSSVDFPDPEGPRMAVVPGSRDSVRSRSTGRPARASETLSSSKRLRPRPAPAVDRADSARPARASVPRARSASTR